MRSQLLGEFTGDLLPDGLTPDITVPVVRDRLGRVSVEEVARAHRQPEGTPPLLLLTSHDLFLSGCHSLFGFASARDQVAIVSSARLGREGDERRRTRLANVIAHERGHLDGLRHCPTRGCVMSRAQSVADIDARGLEPCGRCPRASHRLVGALAAVAVLVLLIAAMDAGATVMRVRKQPFSWHAADGNVSLFFKDSSLVTLGNAGAASPVARAERMTRALNRLFLQVHPDSLEVHPQGTAGALIRAGGQPIVEVLPGDANGRAALQVAQQWAGKIQTLLLAKGLKSESCPGCHIRRIDEIDSEMRNKGRLRR